MRQPNRAHHHRSSLSGVVFEYQDINNGSAAGELALYSQLSDDSSDWQFTVGSPSATFFTLWRIASPAYVAFAIIHCWIGDLMIASFSLALGIIASRSLGSKRFFPAGVIVSVLAGVSYTIFSEWQNMSVHHFWTYSAYMPRLPIVGTGLLPILQWILVPAIALYCARKSPLTLVTVA